MLISNFCLYHLTIEKETNEKKLICETDEIHENVYHIERGIKKLSEGRKNPKHKTAQVILPIFLANNLMQLFLIGRLKRNYKTQREYGKLW